MKLNHPALIKIVKFVVIGNLSVLGLGVVLQVGTSTKSEESHLTQPQEPLVSPSPETLALPEITDVSGIVRNLLDIARPGQKITLSIIFESEDAEVTFKCPGGKTFTVSSEQAIEGRGYKFMDQPAELFDGYVVKYAPSDRRNYHSRLIPSALCKRMDNLAQS